MFGLYLFGDIFDEKDSVRSKTLNKDNPDSEEKEDLQIENEDGFTKNFSVKEEEDTKIDDPSKD